MDVKNKLKRSRTEFSRKEFFKHNLWLVVIILLAAVMLLKSPVTGKAVQDLGGKRVPLSCGSSITERMPAEILLTPADPITRGACRNGPGLKIERSGVVLNCAGNCIRGESNRWTGIVVDTQREVTIKNCCIEGFSSGIDLAYVKDSLVEDTTFKKLEWGLRVTGKSAGNVIRDNFFHTKTSAIFWRSYKPGNQIYGNDIFSPRSISPESHLLPKLCSDEGRGNYLAPDVEDASFLQKDSSCGASKEPFTEEGKRKK